MTPQQRQDGARREHRHAGALVAPFGAQVLTVLYYTLTEPERPVLADA